MSQTPTDPGELNVTDDAVDKSDRSFRNQRYPEDQKKVDEFISTGINSVPRKPFKPIRLMFLLIAVVMALSIFSQFLARWAGVY